MTETPNTPIMSETCGLPEHVQSGERPVGEPRMGGQLRLDRWDIIDLISAGSKNPADHDVEFAERIQDALIAKMATEWASAYAAFQGAFDTPVERRRNSNDFAVDARARLRAFNEQLTQGAQPVAPRGLMACRLDGSE